MLGLDDYGSDSDSDLPKKSPQLVAPAPQPAKKTHRPPKKIAIALPAIKDAPADEQEDIERPTKRQKTGAGASSLLSMLPTPKQANPSLPATQRVLGGGGAKGSAFAFRTQSTVIPPDTTVEDEKGPLVAVIPEHDVPEQPLFRPPSLAKGRKNVSVEEPGIIRTTKSSMQKSLPAPVVDFFSLGEPKSPSSFILPYDLTRRTNPVRC
jgi:proline-rich protein PRCC